jgi:hypothetical protein
VGGASKMNKIDDCQDKMDRLVKRFLEQLYTLDRNEEHWITEYGEMLPWHFIEKIIKYWEDWL